MVETNSGKEELKIKRIQVPKACSNCRKNHAGCDTERPCRRCVQNGLADSCIDVPRKKRVSKRKESNQEDDLVISDIKPEEWEKTFLDLFGTGGSSDDSQSSLESPLETDLKNVDPSLLLAQLEEDPNPTPNASQINSFDLTNLVNQMTELKASNKNLENTLLSVTKELADLKSRTALIKQIPDALSLKGWHHFQKENDGIAISVWKKTSSNSCSGNLLVECNDEFINLLGYPIETLKNNFTCNQLIVGCVKKNAKETGDQRDFPRRTQILTYRGVIEVFMSILPVYDQYNEVKFYILHMMPIPEFSISLETTPNLPLLSLTEFNSSSMPEEY